MKLCVILTVLRIQTTPRKVTEMVQALRTVMRSARAEKGFIACHLYQEAENPNSICYEEQWEARKDLEEQVRSTRFTRLLTLMESAAEQPSLDFYFISETRGLEYIAGVRGSA